MIAIQAKKHDNFSVEFKFGFNSRDGVSREDFSVNAWIFVPNSLDINHENYGKKQFYRDIKSNIRMITPVYQMNEIAQESSLPLTSLRKSIERVISDPQQKNQDAYEYHLKMFAAIFKSALRDQSRYVGSTISSFDYLVADYVESIRQVLVRFRSMYDMIDQAEVPEKVKNYFRLCDEFMSHVTEMRTTKLIRLIDSSDSPENYQSARNEFMSLCIEERNYKTSKSYGVLKKKDSHDRQLVYHRGMLKKFIESELYIRLDKKKDGVAVEQIYYSIAAGVAMIFATGVAWQTQVRYGNITWPLFIALVVSYMLKDRIKDLLRYYFAHKLGNKYYDKKAVITIGNNKVGVIKEGVDFISESKVPAEVMKLREESSFVDEESHIFEEKVLLYRKHVTIDNAALSAHDDYPRRGINEVMRLHMTRFTQKMDNPSVPVDFINEEGELESMNVKKIYYVNIMFLLQYEETKKYHHFRVTMTKNGVLSIDEI